jgi:hypothetical protein
MDIPGTQQGAVWPSRFKWNDFEAYVFGFIRRHAPNATVRRNVRMRGVKSGKLRQIDILVERQIADFRLKIAIDCKCYKRKLNVDDVDRFLGTLDDIRVSKGVLVTAKGYSKAAYQRVENEARDIEVRVVTPDRLSEFQHIGNAFPWREPVGAVVSTPEGWVVDIQPSASSLFTMYPLGHTRDSAVRSEAFLYGKILLKNADTPTMEAIATYDEKIILAKVPTAKFERLSPVVRKSWSGREPEKTLFRVGYIHEGYRGPEYSLYIDHPKGVLLLVLFCPEGQDDAYVPILKRLGETTLMIDCVDSRPERTSETPGRISIYWNRAKYVCVWKRETPDVPWEKVREFVQVLQPVRSLPPPRTPVPEGMFLIESCEFASVVIPTDGLASREIPGEGWAIPLWDPAGLTPKPKILLRFRGLDEPAEVKDPQSLVFYSSTRYPTDPDTWPPVPGVDIVRTTKQETGAGW